jgi:hypothetical protein
MFSLVINEFIESFGFDNKLLRWKDLQAGVVLVFGALEDNDDGDDTAIGICHWVLSIRDKPK